MYVHEKKLFAVLFTILFTISFSWIINIPLAWYFGKIFVEQGILIVASVIATYYTYKKSEDVIIDCLKRKHSDKKYYTNDDNFLEVLGFSLIEAFPVINIALSLYLYLIITSNYTTALLTKLTSLEIRPVIFILTVGIVYWVIIELLKHINDRVFVNIFKKYVN